MHPPEATLDLAEAMVGELEPYLLSSEILWPLEPGARIGQVPLPRLTVGGLLMVMDELSAHKPDLTSEMAARALRLHMRLETLRTKWAVALERKAARELKMRRDLWSAYLEDLEESARAIDDYRLEVRQRVMVSRLVEVSGTQPEVEGTVRVIEGLDARLRKMFRAGPFIWDARLRPIYPPEAFWFLYGRPEIPGP